MALAAAVLLTLALQLAMGRLLAAPSPLPPASAAGPSTTAALWAPLWQQLATPLATLCCPGAPAGKASVWLAGRLGAASQSAAAVLGSHPWRRLRRRAKPAATAAVASRAEAQAPARSAWLPLQPDSTAGLQQELAACSSAAHRCRQELGVAEAEVQRCSAVQASATADALQCQQELSAALDAQVGAAGVGWAARPASRRKHGSMGC